MMAIMKCGLKMYFWCTGFPSFILYMLYTKTNRDLVLKNNLWDCF